MRPNKGPIGLIRLQHRRFLSSTPRRCAKKQQQQQQPLPRSRNGTPTSGREYKPPHQRGSQQQRPPPPPPPPPQTLLDHWRTSWLPLTGAGLLAGLLGFYIIGTVTASLRDSPCPACTSANNNDGATPTGRPPALTGDNAEQFDKELDWPETLMGIKSLRKRIAKEARGHVLEVAMGTGRNLEYYDWSLLSAAAQGTVGQQSATTQTSTRAGITSFTGLDVSPDMLDVARRKLTKSVPPMASLAPLVRASSTPNSMGGQLSYLNGHLRFVTSDAHDPLPPPSNAITAAPGSSSQYDTVIQTFGLCSVSDPVAVLSNLASSVRPDTGRIVLLEHGRGFFGIVNGLLDRNAGKHFGKYGCWWNRDIEALVQEAAKQTPGLEVVKTERPNILQMGTLIWVELRVAEKRV